MNWGIIIIIDVAEEYVYFCKLGPKEYIEGEAVKMYIRLNFFLSPKLFYFWLPELKSFFHHLTNEKCLRGTQCAQLM